MQLSELGEFALIEHITKDITLQQSSTIKGVGDDAAVRRMTENDRQQRRYSGLKWRLRNEM